MYRNLEAEMTRKGIKKKHIAALLDITKDTLTNKLQGKSDFTVSEASKIRDTHFEEMTFEYLFKKLEE